MNYKNIDDLINDFDYSYHNNYNSFLLKGKRQIYSPEGKLKKYQFQIKELLEKKYTFPFFVTGYRKGLTISDNANIHKGKKYIINIDISDFFGSITRKHLYNEFKGVVKDIDLFLDYITFKGVLPQGPPSSPILSNIIFKKIDFTIKKVLINLFGEDLSYSRYVDDISVGFNDYHLKDKILSKLKELLNQNGFIINSKKTKLFHYNKKLFVTGMIINDNSIGIGYKKYRFARKLIYLYLQFKQGYFPSIKGLLLYVKGVDYSRYEQLKNIYFNKYSDSEEYQELFGIDSKGKKIIKEKQNKFNRIFNYSDNRKYNRFTYSPKDLFEDCTESEPLDYS